MAQTSLEKIKDELKEIVKTVDKQFGENYAAKNPELVKHLLDKIQQQEDRALTEKIHVKL